MAKRVEVPAWGNWEGENVEYSAVFEKARRGRQPGAGRKVIDPNDLRQNPYAGLQPRYEERQKNNLYAEDSSSYASQSPARAIRSSNYSDSRPGDPRRASKGFSDADSVSNNSTPLHDQAIRAANVEHAGAHHRGTSIPVFGSWNENGQAPGVGYTMIFNRVKTDKSGPQAMLPPLLQPVQVPEKERTAAKKNTTPSRNFKSCFCFTP